MRRSKSNPAKYARNYRAISQRRMTAREADDDPAAARAEMERLRAILRDGSSRGGDDNDISSSGGKRPRSPPRPTASEPSGGDGSAPQSCAGILSDELLQEAGVSDASELLLLPGRKPKKAKPDRPAVVLTPQELRQAKLLQKNARRKLAQLEQRAAQKQKRTELYAKLEATAVPQRHMELLESSADFSKKKSKQEKLRRLLKRERAGLELTQVEKDLLYVDVEGAGGGSVDTNSIGRQVRASSACDTNKKTELDPSLSDNAKPASNDKSETSEPLTVSSEKRKERREPPPSSSSLETSPTTGVAPQSSESKPQSIAAMMLASLSKVKQDSDNQAQRESHSSLQGKLEALAVSRPATERYVPSAPTVVKTAAAMGLQSAAVKAPATNVVEIPRPPDIQAARMELPVSAMEFEVMDAIRNNDVTIICGETGSGKSTQIPAFVYSAGLTLSQLNAAGGNDHYMIGVTQPRRVAAVSTAKRVCYEMGQGDGQSIRSDGVKGNLVAYQTRYETAGLGTNCHIKFMTDGILLQEIQSDLLLRKYSVIILDEAHERNLNTDVLIGLLSVALPLRKQAAEEEGSSIVRLKLIIMSATLRVEDFTANKMLFPACQPTVVTIPGRTHPVTIHHSKVTELMNYEDEAFRKVCKIHRKLPNGGILVFLTGRQEIVRMVNRLRRSLCKFQDVPEFSDTQVMANDSEVQAPRDLDDDEFDADLFISKGMDEKEDKEQDDSAESKRANENEVTDEDKPMKAVVLPLYSLLSAEDQAKVFSAVPDGHRLIVVSTNIAETSLTIPGTSYVVDTGRQKCRNYNPLTGVSSYDIMWISQAAANQRAGRAGRTGPGHCYRLYSSSMFARHMDAFAPPEVLTRPLDDVVLAMKAMKITNVSAFPFPTPPDKDQVVAALQLLMNLGCLNSSNDPKCDGDITRLGLAIARLPLGVRYGKILLVGAQAGVLDYILPVVAVMSESSPFVTSGDQRVNEKARGSEEGVDTEPDSDDPESEDTSDESSRKTKRWYAKGGDILAAALALGGYTYAGHGAGGMSEKIACKKFCEENGLNETIMYRIQKIRLHLARLARQRLSHVSGVAAKTGGIVSSMPPPNKLHELLLRQAIASGLLDNVAMLAPPGSIPGDHPYSLRSAYIGSTVNMREPLFMDRNSVLYSRDSRQLPQWVCYHSLLRKTHKDGTPFAVMKGITPIDPSWLGRVATGSQLLRLGDPKPFPPPVFDNDQDAILCHVITMFGRHGWEIPAAKVEMSRVLQTMSAGKSSAHFAADDSFRWFARFLLEGKVLSELAGLTDMLNDSPALITRKATTKKAILLVSALVSDGIDTASSLRRHWAEVDEKFLFKQLRPWVKVGSEDEAKRIWIAAVKKNISKWKAQQPKS